VCESELNMVLVMCDVTVPPCTNSCDIGNFVYIVKMQKHSFSVVSSLAAE